MRQIRQHEPGSWYENCKPRETDVVDKTSLFDINVMEKTLIQEVEACQKLYPFERKDAKGWTSIPLRSVGGITGRQASAATGVHASSEGSNFAYTPVAKHAPTICALAEQVATAHNSSSPTAGRAAAALLKIRLLKLEAGAQIPMHVDHFDGKRKVTRFHVPIVTHPNAIMIVNNKRYHLAAGHVYVVDVSQPHAVQNNSDVDRIHLVFDCA
jgi:quercetin dioxygenase-like cupin family protein